MGLKPLHESFVGKGSYPHRGSSKRSNLLSLSFSRRRRKQPRPHGSGWPAAHSVLEARLLARAQADDVAAAAHTAVVVAGFSLCLLRGSNVALKRRLHNRGAAST